MAESEFEPRNVASYGNVPFSLNIRSSILQILKHPLESFMTENKEAGIVFGSLPIYRVS